METSKSWTEVVKLLAAIVGLVTALASLWLSVENGKDIQQQSGELNVYKDSIRILNNQIIEVKANFQTIETKINVSEHTVQTGEKNYQIKQGNVEDQTFN
jgi:hypothetical protein